ncbi:unnamed protein product [Nesidiocoris tenuis]|uniref:Uncharacterized protein n=1 Tax=Nesidiocoris tenuis TaxID=355587 RepID=A0A6H5G9L4_9HEMI|nr:unnamed protein product [Nesidiocoris tenuis]
MEVLRVICAPLVSLYIALVIGTDITYTFCIDFRRNSAEKFTLLSKSSRTGFPKTATNSECGLTRIYTFTIVMIPTSHGSVSDNCKGEMLESLPEQVSTNCTLEPWLHPALVLPMSVQVLLVLIRTAAGHADESRPYKCKIRVIMRETGANSFKRAMVEDEEMEDRKFSKQ